MQYQKYSTLLDVLAVNFFQIYLYFDECLRFVFI
jgi:hypothetical protein